MTPQTRSLSSQLCRKGANREGLARKVMRQSELLAEVFEGLQAKEPAIKYGSGKILRLISEEEPALLYPKIGFFIKQLDSDNNFLKWDAIYILGNLAAVDSKKKIDKILERYFAPIRGPALVTAANIVQGGARIAQAKPKLTEDIVSQLLKVEKGKYKTAECRNVVLGKLIEALGEIFEQVEKKRRVLNLVTRQCKNPRPATRKKAEKFMRRWGAEPREWTTSALCPRRPPANSPRRSTSTRSRRSSP